MPNGVFFLRFFTMKRRHCLIDLMSLFDDDNDEENFFFVLHSLLFSKRRKTHEMIRKRDTEGVYSIFITKYLLTDDDKFHDFLRVTPYLFNVILNNIRDLITTLPSKRVKNPISPQHKLCVALRFLATGESLASLSFSFRISRSHLTNIVRSVFKAIKDTMIGEIPMPTKEQFLSIADEFYRKWNFPNAIGCLDGKHVRVRCPDATGSIYYNYKDFFSVVLLALVDANYKFIAIDVGSFGREGDAGEFLLASTYINVFFFK